MVAHVIFAVLFIAAHVVWFGGMSDVFDDWLNRKAPRWWGKSN